MNSPLCIAFVDPIIAPVYLAETLHAHSVKIVAIYTVQLVEEEQKARLHPELFDKIIYCDTTTDIKLVAAELKKLNVQYVFYGYEASVKFTDKLAKLVCPQYANNPDTSSYRSDKSAMQHALQVANIPNVKQLELNINTFNKCSRLLKEWDYPLIVKPIHGGLSIGVKKCDSFTELENFFNTEKHVLLHSETAKEYVVQEYLNGTEYFVDTVSLLGNHSIVSVQRYEKIFYKGAPIYRSSNIVNPQSKEWHECCDYALQVLNAVGLENGFGHTEIILSRKGPRLIEINPRISGISGFGNIMAEKTLHTNQPKALVQRILKQPYQSPKKLYHCGKIVIINNWKSRVISELNMKLLTSLSSFNKELVFKNAGDYIGSPKSLRDTIALILLISNVDENAQLMKDSETLAHWEMNNQLF